MAQVLAVCEKTDSTKLNFTDSYIERHTISVLVVVLDIFILFLFMISIFKLRTYETNHEEDLKQMGYLKIEDFSVVMDVSTIDPKKYI